MQTTSSTASLPRHRTASEKSGFTLVEMLVATTLFAIIGSLALGVFINVSRFGQHFKIRQRLQNEAQFIIAQLSNTIADNAIDYEEYFNQVVMEGLPGMHFGHYGTQFYASKTTPAGTQNKCHLTPNDCEQIGQNPPKDDPLYSKEANAFMIVPFSVFGSKQKAIFCDSYDPVKELKINKRDYVCVQRLFLINPSGTGKIFIAPEEFTVQSADGSSGKGISQKGKVLSKSSMTMSQEFPGFFSCLPGPECSGEISGFKTINISNEEKPDTLFYSDFGDLTDEDPDQDPYGKDFQGFTSKNVHIKKIEFYIAPAENPQKAFFEKNSSQKNQVLFPILYIVLEIEPIENLLLGTSYPSLRLEKSITPQVTPPSPYPPVMDCSNGITAKHCSLLRIQ